MTGWPVMFEFLSSENQLNKYICLRAVQDLGVCEEPPSSNRGLRIDEYNQRAGAPAGSYWCASWATAVWEDVEVDLPKSERASCDKLVAWAIEQGLWIPYDPTVSFPAGVHPGCMVVYTNGNHLPGSPALDAVHVGIVLRREPYMLSIEGNAAYGGVFSANGEAVVLKRVDFHRVYGFIVPRLKS